MLVAVSTDAASSPHKDFQHKKFDATVLASLQLLNEQCKAFSVVPLSKKQKFEYLLGEFEKQSLKINNLSDALSNFVNLPESRLFTREIINCQIKLSDTWRNLLYQPQVENLIQQLTNSHNAKFRELGFRLSQARNSQATQNQLARLRILEAEIAQWAKKKTPVIPSKLCLIPNQENIIDNSILHFYLLNQPQESCRKQIWTQFYKQSTTIVQDWIEQKNTIAQYSGYRTFIEQQQFYNILNKPQSILNYLQSKSSTTAIEPWNIGQILKNAPRTSFAKLQLETLLAKSFIQLSKLGISTQQLTPNLYRIWLNKRLLGHLYLDASQTKSGSRVVRYPVIGHQFADITLTAPKILTSNRKVKQFISQLARTVTIMADSPEFYLSSNTMDFSDSRELGAIWLTKWLQQQLKITTASKGSREQIAQTYQQQLNIIKAKWALLVFTGQEYNVPALSAFNHSSSLVNYIYSDPNFFSQNIGIYKGLFQDDLASMLLEKSKISANQIFEILVVNESRQAINKRLNVILAHPFELKDIININKLKSKKRSSN
ncbi:hypothetical protein D5018_14935 [Parashewanella curva]|uniref:Peptidase M3A/M3B catalytic domain-containing protein n=1 Tax=Parashewanella curva TaxID=2338552 RepID=A0A3L8PUA7_9GAMM|nr:hypothetical protein D5018_14935 [Parashewanella curva]